MYKTTHRDKYGNITENERSMHIFHLHSPVLSCYAFPHPPLDIIYLLLVKKGGDF